MSKLIPLTRGFEAIVDDDDHEWLSQWSWYYFVGYAARSSETTTGRRVLFMHRFIAQSPADLSIDHINLNKLDNRRINLRVATDSQNQMNTPKRRGQYSSVYKGVSFQRNTQKWVARITLNYKDMHIGCFVDEIDAARAYDAKARGLHGEFAYLNFSDE